MRPILITGCPRSGTSLVAAIIAKHGIFGGDTEGGKTNYNPIGMFENFRIRNEVAKQYLRSIGADPMGQNPLPERHIIWKDPEFKNKVENIFYLQGWEGERWFLKEAKMALMWEVWNDAFPDAQWVLVRRNDQDIINSCMKTPFMSRRKKVSDWQKWVDYHKDRFEEMKGHLSIAEIWPKYLIEEDYKEMSAILKWLGVDDYNSLNRIRSVINPKHWHNQTK